MNLRLIGAPVPGRHHLLLLWLMLAGAAGAAIFAGIHTGVLQTLFNGDRSRICWVITLMFVYVSLHCARRVLLVSTELNSAAQIEARVPEESALRVNVTDGRVRVEDGDALPDCLLTEYIRDLFRKGTPGRATSAEGDPELLDVYESRLKSPQEIGWFLADVMIKLGLLGTIVGFVMMLGSVGAVTNFDATTMQGVLRQMSSGMGTALYTTFVGLVCSILTTFQYYLLDQGADELIRRTRHFAQVHVAPEAAATTA